ncbi:MAG: hypothetical protein OIF40_07270 [Mangrovicoccus sp.]|nr:hypothetical protein [Mangrovicoccus sp.]
MKSVILGIAGALLLSVLAWGITGQLGSSSAERFTSPNNSVRLE